MGEHGAVLNSENKKLKSLLSHFKVACVVKIAFFDPPEKTRSVIIGNLAFDLKYRVHR